MVDVWAAEGAGTAVPAWVALLLVVLSGVAFLAAIFLGVRFLRRMRK